jgi:hypothetical protein
MTGLREVMVPETFQRWPAHLSQIHRDLLVCVCSTGHAGWQRCVHQVAVTPVAF